MASGLNCAMFARGGFRKSGSLRFSGFGLTLIFGEVDASKIYRRSRRRVSGIFLVQKNSSPIVLSTENGQQFFP